MPYTLMKGLVWVLLAVLLGIFIGWFLRSVTARRELARARAAATDGSELDQLRARVANLEPVVNERDRLKFELDEAVARADAAEAAQAQPDAAEPVEEPAAEPAPEPAAEPATDSGVSSFAEMPASGDTTAPDLAAAAAAIGTKIALDDLTVIEGIGPKIAELCGGIGINTWAELAETEVSLLRTMLTDAGQRFKAHDPTTWPRQAGMLAAGSWAEFKQYTDELDGGREVT